MAILWRTNYEAGSLSAWNQLQAADPARLTIATIDGVRCLRAEVRPGDVAFGGCRAEVVHSTPPVGEGAERWYSWRSRFPGDFVSPAGKWQLAWQAHQLGDSGSPPLALTLYGEALRLSQHLPGSTEGIIHWTAPLVRDRWLAFVLGVKWSNNPAVGWAELRVDGSTVLPRKGMRTMHDAGVYLKMGWYRNATIDIAQRVFHGDIIEADAAGDVAQSPAVPEPTAPSAASPLSFRLQATDGRWWRGELKPEEP